MPKTFLQLKNEVQQITPSDPSVGDFINDALVDIIKSSRRSRKNSYTVTDGGVTIPTDCLFVRKVAWEGVPLNLYPGEETPVLGTGRPLYWQQTETHIMLYPTPSLDAGGKVEIIYCPRPAELVSDTDVPTLTGIDTALIAYAKWKIYTKKEDTVAADIWRAEYAYEKLNWLELDMLQQKRTWRINVGSYS